MLLSKKCLLYRAEKYFKLFNIPLVKVQFTSSLPSPQLSIWLHLRSLWIMCLFLHWNSWSSVVFKFLQFSGISSEPSLQSFDVSHSQSIGMQGPYSSGFPPLPLLSQRNSNSFLQRCGLSEIMKNKMRVNNQGHL